MNQKSDITAISGKELDEIKVILSNYSKFDPLPSDHPAVGMNCFLCRDKISAGDETCLIPTGPDDAEDEEKMKAGRPYNSKAEIAHVSCLTTAVTHYVTHKRSLK